MKTNTPKTKTHSSGIVSWPEDERPRERLLSHGPDVLTDAELLAILIRVGFRGTSAVELGRQLLKQFGSLNAVAKVPMLALLKIKGLKGAKAAQLLAAMEIARRVAVPHRRNELQFKSTSVTAAYVAIRLRGLADEHFRVLYLNRRNALLDDALIAKGAVDSVHPSLRDIISRAMQLNASMLVAAHNHPSGVPEPSESDRLLTKDLIAATRPLSLRLLDHVIVCDDATFSFADSGLLDELEMECLTPEESKGHRKLPKESN